MLCIRLDKVTAIADVLQHEHKNLRLPGQTLNGLESGFLICEIKRITHGDE